MKLVSLPSSHTQISQVCPGVAALVWEAGLRRMSWPSAQSWSPEACRPARPSPPLASHLGAAASPLQFLLHLPLVQSPFPQDGCRVQLDWHVVRLWERLAMAGAVLGAQRWGVGQELSASPGRGSALGSAGFWAPAPSRAPSRRPAECQDMVSKPRCITGLATVPQLPKPVPANPSLQSPAEWGAGRGGA